MRLVVNRKPPRPRKPKPPPKRATPRSCLRLAAEHAADMTAVLIVGHHRDGATRLCWSDMTNADLLWLSQYAAHRLKGELLDGPP